MGTYSDSNDSLLQEAAKNEMVKGALWLVVGALVSLIGYVATSSDGGTYYVFWGAMAYGAYRFIRALYYWFNPSALLAKPGE